MKYVFENKVEFYITNVCNLTCEDCNRFNNHNFTGWQDWNDYADIYRAWANVIDLKNIVLIGGEPLLNPTVCDWMKGCNETFNCDVQILSNGTRLLKVKNLYETCLNHKGHVSISLHNMEHFEQLYADINEFLGPIKEEYGPAIGKDRNDGIFYSARDVNDVLVNMHVSWWFQPSAVVALPNGRFTLRQSDPVSAFKECGFARHKCYHFIRGKIYKCGPVALMPEFDQQFDLDISSEDRELLNQYQPMTLDRWDEFGSQWIAELDNPIAQCKFCSSSPYTKQIFPIKKGSGIDK